MNKDIGMVRVEKKHLDIEKIVPLSILVVLFLIFSMFSETFLKWSTIQMLLEQNAAVGIASMGIMIVVITGSLDFSCAQTLALAGVASTRIYMATGENLWVMVISVLLIGAVVGFVNGVIITKLKINAFIATLSTMTILKGLTMIIGEASAPELTKPDIIFVGNGMIFDVIPMPLVILAFMILLSSFLLNKTRLGVYWYAVGGNEEVAVQAGINVARTRILCHMYAGICAGIASIITISRIRTVLPNISGTILLDGLAAAIIGGTAVTGGKGTVFGAITGVFIIALVSTALVFFHVPAVYQTAIKGASILIALILNATIQEAAEKSALKRRKES